MKTERFVHALLLCVLFFISSTAWTGEIDIGSSAPADPQLTQFVYAIVEVHPLVQAAKEALVASRAKSEAASQPLYNPELNIDLENSDSDTRALSISQTLDWAGKRKARTDVAKLNRLVVEADYLSVRWNVTVKLLNGLAQYQTAVERDVLANSRQQLMNDIVALAERRFDAGDMNQLELDLTRLSAMDARIQRATSAGDLAEARGIVQSLTLRRPEMHWPTLPDSLPKLPTRLNSQALMSALPQVIAARGQVERADAIVELRRRERRPDPTLNISGGKEDGKTLIGVNMSIPLFLRNSFSHEVTVALAERSQAQQIADDVLQRAQARLISAADRFDVSLGAWGDWQLMGVASIQRQTVQLQRLWQSGELSTTDYLVQLTASLDVQESALELRESMWLAWFEWLLASGQVDSWLGN